MKEILKLKTWIKKSKQIQFSSFAIAMTSQVSQLSHWLMVKPLQKTFLFCTKIVIDNWYSYV